MCRVIALWLVRCRVPRRGRWQSLPDLDKWKPKLTQLLVEPAAPEAAALRRVPLVGEPIPAPRRLIALVTGATDGIGEAVAHRLAGIVDTLVVHGRCPYLLGALASELAPANPGTSIVPVMADLQSLSEVRELTESIRKRFDHLDILINNAATAAQYPRTLTQDGHEMALQVNYLSPVLLTAGLFDLLEAGCESRIVNVVCDVYRHTKTINQTLSDHRRYHPVSAYAQSKFTQVVHTASLTRALSGRRCSAVCLDPGQVDTKLGRRLIDLPEVSVAEAADNVLYAATMPTSAQGFYLKEKEIVKPEPEVFDSHVQRQLDSVTEELLDVRLPWTLEARVSAAANFG